MQIDATSDRVTKGILLAYTSQVENNLYNDLLETLKPKLREAARSAAKELAPSIATMLDDYGQKMVVQILLKGVDDAD